MSKPNLQILQVSTYDIAGGAEKIAWDLFQAYKDLGYQSTLIVGTKRSNDPSVFCIPNNQYRSPTAKIFISIGNHLDPFVTKIPFGKKLNKNLKIIGETKRRINIINGVEDFDYPGTSHILEIPKRKPNIVHCHNLHGGYFDLRILPKISHQVPVVMTLHDAWLLSGHCAHSFECEKWKKGCGNCPDLTIYPEIKRDATVYNWNRKKDIFSKSRLYVVTPCQWLMDKVNQSILKPGIVASKVIPNGVDLKVFHPADKTKARVNLGLPIDAKILLFAANGIRKNIWKDYKTLQSSLAKIARNGTKVLCIALGEMAPPEHICDVEIRFIPFQRDPNQVARYYQAADIYVHPARAETFPTTVLEALACGTPVLASAVGGISEQIEDGVTGFLIPQGDAKTMAGWIVYLLADDGLRHEIGKRAAEDAKRRFGMDGMVGEYLHFYEEILKKQPI